MAWYADLSPCYAFGHEFAPYLTAVGWLDDRHAVPTGQVEQAVYDRLADFARGGFYPPALPIALGFHECELCLYDRPRVGGSIFIPATDTLYVCPASIVHYMSAHRYRPPAEFCEAVLRCADMSSMEYLKAVIAVARPLCKVSGPQG